MFHYLPPGMKFLMPLLVVISCESPPTLPTLKWPLARMTPQMTLQMKASGKPLITQIALPPRLCNHLRLRSERFRLVRSLGMEHLLMLLEVFVGGESELGNGAVREEAVKGSVVAVDVLFAGLGGLEAFMKVEAVRARTLEVLLAVVSCDFFGVEVVGSGERFDHVPISHDDFAESFDTDLFACFRALSIVLIDMVPDLEQLCMKWVGLEWRAVFQGVVEN